jgi:hypothetical protein
MNDENKLFDGFGFTSIFTLLGVVAMFCGLMLYGAWAIAFISVHFWMWFVVPVFGLAPLKMSAAFGLSLLIRLWTHQYIKGHKENRSMKEQFGEGIGNIVSPWFALLCGYICHHFFM